MLVTTSSDPTEQVTASAQAAATELHAKWVARGRNSLAKLMANHSESAILLVSRERLEYHQIDQPVFYFHPSMAAVRVKRLLRGEGDTLLTAADVRKGDTVLDCTAGLASDSIVLAHAVGSEGRVTALESEQVIQYVVREGLKRYVYEVEALNEAMRRVELLHANHDDYLRQADSKSVDIVYFDPMFRQPIHESSSISPLRGLANGGELASRTLEEACRVARKAVVMKEITRSSEWKRLNFTDFVKASPKIAFGVIRL